MVARFEKVVSSLPSTITPDTIYAVRRATGFDLRISDSTGTVAHKLNEKGLPSGYVAHVFGGFLYFGYGAYEGGGWVVIRVGADGSRGFADGVNNAVGAFPVLGDWSSLTFTGY